MGKNMILCFVIAVLTGIGFFLTLSKKLKKHRENNSLFYEFVLTVLATFLGAFLALTVTNIDTVQSEKQKLIKMLQLSINEIESIQTNLGIYYTDLIDKKKPYSIAEHAENNNIPFSNVFDQALTNDIIIRRMTEETYANLINGRNNAKKQLEYLNQGALDNDKMMLYIDLYGRELDYLLKVMHSEIAFNNGEISQEKLFLLQDSYKYELLGLTPEKLNNAIKGQSN